MTFPQPHLVTVIEPAQPQDSRGDIRLDYSEDAAGITDNVPAWLQEGLGPRGASETLSDRDVSTSRWTFYSMSTPQLTALARIVWNGKTFSCDGQPNHVNTPTGYHHTEANLQLVEG